MMKNLVLLKKLILILIAAIIMYCLNACSGTDNNNNNSNSIPSTQLYVPTWNTVGDGLSDMWVTALAAGINDDIYAATTNGEIAQLGVDGESWVVKGTNFSNIKTLAVDNQGNLYTGTGQGIWRLAKGAESWVSFSTGIPKSTAMVNVIIAGKWGNVYAGTEGDGKNGEVWKLNDSKESWVMLGNNLTYGIITSLAIDKVGNIYTGTGGNIDNNYTGQVLKYEPSISNNWQVIGESLEDDEVKAVAVDGYYNVYVGTRSGHVWILAAGSNTWESQTELPNNLDQVASLAIDSANNLYAGTSVGQVWQHNFATGGWLLLGDLNHGPIRSIVVDNKDQVFAATESGVWQLSYTES